MAGPLQVVAGHRSAAARAEGLKVEGRVRQPMTLLIRLGLNSRALGGETTVPRKETSTGLHKHGGGKKRGGDGGGRI